MLHKQRGEPGGSLCHLSVVEGGSISYNDKGGGGGGGGAVLRQSLTH